MESNCETALPKGLTLDGLFSRGGYRARMALKRLQPDEFFANLRTVDVLKERSALLEARSQDFISEPASREDTDALIQFAGSWATVRHAHTFRELGAIWEPDFVLLRRGQSLEVVGGCVCFPTGWSLTKIQQRTLSIVHGPVPGLNLQLGSKVERFLADLKLGECYQRSNWGLTSSSQMNQHPGDNIAEIASDCDPAGTFLRVEWQAVMPVDDFRVIFGIRIYQFALESIRHERGAAQLLKENLLTMPDDMLRYKRLTRCRHRVLEILSTP
jgi:Haem-dependent oxidative N-demethylase, alpha subunit-like